MAMDVYRAIREIEKVISRGETIVYDGLRSWMMTRLTDAASTYLRRSSDTSRAVRSMANEVGEEVARAICYPQALTSNELLDICGIYGRFFSQTSTWAVPEQHFTKLLEHVPGKTHFRSTHDTSWEANMELRKKLPTALTLTFEAEKLRKLPEYGNGSIASHQKVAAAFRAFGYSWNTNERLVVFYFDNDEDFVFAKMKYS